MKQPKRGDQFRSKFFGPGNLCLVSAVRKGNFYYTDTVTGDRYQAPVDCWEGSQMVENVVDEIRERLKGADASVNFPNEALAIWFDAYRKDVRILLGMLGASAPPADKS